MKLVDQVRASTVFVSAERSQGPAQTGVGVFFHFHAASREVPALLLPRALTRDIDSLTFHFRERMGSEDPRPGAVFSVELRSLSGLCLDHPKAEVEVTALPLMPLIALAQKQAGKRPFYVPFEEAFLAIPRVRDGLHKHQAVRVVGYPPASWDLSRGVPALTEAATLGRVEESPQPGLGFLDQPPEAGCLGAPVVVLEENPDSERLVLFGLLSDRAIEVEGTVGKAAAFYLPETILELARTVQTQLGLRS